jgi:hypothetical protein
MTTTEPWPTRHQLDDDQVAALEASIRRQAIEAQREWVAKQKEQAG